MFGLQGDNEEETFAKNEKLLKELIIRSNEQEERFENFFKGHHISKEELLAFLSDPENFDEKTWSDMQQMRAEFHAEIKRKLNQIHNPINSKKKYSDLCNARQWIPVR